MAAAAKERPQPETDQPPARTGGRLPVMALAIAAGVLVLEASTVLVIMWLNGGPAKAQGGQPAVAVQQALAGEDIEELLLEGRATNMKRGTTFVYRFRIYALLEKDQVETVRSIAERRKATVEDTVRQVVARLDPQDLDDPKLVAFRRVLMSELEPVFGAGRIKQLLVPEFPRTRVD